MILSPDIGFAGVVERFWHLLHSRSKGTKEISQLRSGWCVPKNLQVLQGRGISAVPSGLISFNPVSQPLRSWLMSGCRFATGLLTVSLFFVNGVLAQTTNADSNATPILGDVPRFHLEGSSNGLLDAVVQGRNLAKQLVEVRPSEALTNTGTLQIRSGQGKERKASLTIQTVVGTKGWSNTYSAILYLDKDRFSYVLIVGHLLEQAGSYHLTEETVAGRVEKELSPDKTMVPFAGSDFWLCDLGLEFFHWPDQKIIKKEFSRGRGCMVLESTNPNPTNGYSKVDCWIDEESYGIVHAEAFDPKGKKLKEFDPKSFKKVNGQWQLQDMEIQNVQTGSRTTIRFDLHDTK
jgi:Outer membrane lipoprotein-sorting protein